MEGGKKLVHHTALALTFEVQNQQIQALRAKYDPAFERWPPHINLCFPFVDIPEFEEVHKLLSAKLNNFPAFEIRFRVFDTFPNGTMFVVPETAYKQIQNLYKLIVETIPDLKANRQFHPHMTLGKFDKKQIYAKKIELEKDWQQWRVECQGVSMIHRGKNTPFELYKQVKLAL